MHFTGTVAAIGFLPLLIHAQVPEASTESASFNGTFSLTATQISSANLSSTSVSSINNIVSFDLSQLANGGPREDTFYTLPVSFNNTGAALRPGILLKTQAYTNPENFTLPPNTALSRILYTTANINGTVIPASAFILWPFTPRRHDKDSAKAPVVLWAHGTSGFFPTAAPSAHRSLWYGYSAPFALAQTGYAVVAPDYAGLGVLNSWEGSRIPHHYLASPEGANDALYALRAARNAFPSWMQEQYVVMGHSQGGGVAWGVAEALVSKEKEFADLVAGYLGTIAGSPTTDAFSGAPSFILPWVGMTLNSIFPDFDLSLWLTPLGVARTKLQQEIEGGQSVSTQLYFTGEEIVNNNYNETWYADAYGKLGNAGRKPFKGPLLVLQGTEDPYIPYTVTTGTVEDTCAQQLDADLELLVVNGTGHVPVLDATKQLWLDWIDERFQGKPAKKGCTTRDLESFLPSDWYQRTGTSFQLWAGAPEYSYTVPLGL